MKKNLVEKTVYQPNSRVKVTVTNKPEVTEEGKPSGYNQAVTIAINAGHHNTKLSFVTDEDIARFVETINFEDPQTALAVGDEN